MYDKVIEQAESLLKPMNDIVTLNVEAFDSIRVKQAELVNEVLADSIEYAKGFSKPTLDISAFVETQQNYWEGVGNKISNTAQDNYELMTDVQGKVGDILQVAFDASAVAEKAKAPVKKKAPAKKAAAKTKEAKVENAPETTEG